MPICARRFHRQDYSMLPIDNIKDDVVIAILDLLKEAFGAYFKAYYDGDPIDIPKSNLPCVIVEGNQGRTSLNATGTDMLESSVNITIALDKRDDYGAEPTKDLTEKRLRRIVEARNSTTGAYLDDTIVGVLRQNITIGNRTVDNEVNWAYALQPRTDTMVTSEARIEITTKERIFVGTRT